MDPSQPAPNQRRGAAVRAPGRSLAAAAAIAVFAAPAIAMPPEGIAWVTKEVHGYRVSLATESLYDRAAAEPKHANAFDHRLLVRIGRADAAPLAELPKVEADVAALGYRGEVVPLARTQRGGQVIYEGRVRMQRAMTYRILVYFTPPGSERTVEARHEYRHHH